MQTKIKVSIIISTLILNMATGLNCNENKIEEYYRGYITIPYGNNEQNPYNGNKKISNYVFVSMKIGTPIKTIKSGFVRKIGKLSGYANSSIMIEISNNKYIIYGCIKAEKFKIGDHVEKDNIIGKAGGSGDTCGMQGPGILIQYLNNNEYENPIILFD